MKNLLWLPAWYPNKLLPYDGDFIQRHARAVSLFNKIQVIHVIRDKTGKVTKNIFTETVQDANLNEKIIYYYSPSYSISLFDKVFSTRHYNRIYKNAIKEYIEESVLPTCTHVHVVNKNGLMALWLKRKYKVPFVISEHWTGYLPAPISGFKNMSSIFKSMWKRVVNESAGMSTVSQYLASAINSIQNSVKCTIIPNVVDDNIFSPSVKAEEKTSRFIHISGLDYQKNPEAIIEALAIVRKSNPDFSLSVFGPAKEKLQQLVESCKLTDQVIFYGEVPQKELAKFVQQSDVLILYSRYETFGCVIIEANACGVPAIVSDLPVFHETITEGVNGYFVEGENPEALAKKILWFMNNRNVIDKKKIAATAKEKYNYPGVAKMFDDFYNEKLKD